LLVTQGIVAVRYLVALKVLEYALVQAVIRLFVKEFGAEIAFLAALVAAAYGFAEQFGDKAAAFTVTAQEYLQLANSLTKAITQQVMDDFNGLQTEMEEFDLLREKQSKFLEEQMDLLQGSSILSPMVILGEAPNTYYRRTIHSGNIGLMILEDTHYFVERSLTLPTLADSVEGYVYV
jgi:hypothetical protein